MAQDDKDKIDAKLRAEIERLEKERKADDRLSVVIEPIKGDEAGVAAARDSIWSRLQEMKAKDARQLALTSALVASLTASEIRALAADQHVRRIFLNAPEKVTAKEPGGSTG